MGSPQRGFRRRKYDPCRGTASARACRHARRARAAAGGGCACAESRLMVVGETRSWAVSRCSSGSAPGVRDRLPRLGRAPPAPRRRQGDRGPRRGGRRRVLREAQAAARLNHRGIVTLYELGEDGRNAYLVSELAEGETLDELARAGRISDRAVGRIGAELCDALAHAHENGVVHRDIKPQNIVVRPADRPLPAGSPRAKLMDFGIAHLHDGAEADAHRRGRRDDRLHGPRAGRGRRRDARRRRLRARADAVRVLERGATRSRARLPAATARAIGEPLPSARRAARRDLPAELCEAIDACLEVDPDERPDGRRARPRARGGAAAPQLDQAPSRPRAAPRPHGPRRARAPGARSRALAAIFAAVAWLALVAGRPGAALVVACLVAPIPLLLDRPLLLGAARRSRRCSASLGIAPLYPALAALGADRRAPLRARDAGLRVARVARVAARQDAALRHRRPRALGLDAPRPSVAARTCSAPLLAPEPAARRPDLGPRPRPCSATCFAGAWSRSSCSACSCGPPASSPSIACSRRGAEALAGGPAGDRRGGRGAGRRCGCARASVPSKQAARARPSRVGLCPLAAAASGAARPRRGHYPGV